MDSNRNHSMGMPDGTGAGEGTGHIWLRYATQFSVGERSYTIDMGIPVPLGADEETRERLLSEANAGMDQLSRHVEWRVAQLQQNAAPVPSARTLPTQRSAASSQGAVPASSSTPASSARPANTPAPVSRPASQGNAAAAANVPASSAVPAASAPAREMPADQQSSQSRQSMQSTQPAQSAPPTQKRPVAVPPTRPNIGASMPPSPGLPGGTMQLPQFLQYIKEMGLDARQAMDLLKVKSLSGLNLRDALEQLQHIVMKEGATTPVATPASTPPSTPTQSTPAQDQVQRPKTGERGPGSNPGASKQADTTSAPASTGASTTPSNSTRSAARSSAASTPASSSASPTPSAPRISGSVKGSAVSEPKPVVIQEERAPYPGFDEEEDDFGPDFDEDEDEEIGVGGRASLSAANRGTAEDIVERLREARGTTAVSAQRVIVLHNVIGDQVRPEQLQALIRGIWGATSERKLKNEQAEALISWGKQDDFVTEAEMVLALFEEDADARSDR